MATPTSSSSSPFVTVFTTEGNWESQSASMQNEIDLLKVQASSESISLERRAVFLNWAVQHSQSVSDVVYLLSTEQEELQKVFTAIQDNDVEKNTLLHMACLRRHESDEEVQTTIHIIDRLIDDGIPIFSQNNEHKTALALIIEKYKSMQQPLDAYLPQVIAHLLSKLPDSINERASLLNWAVQHTQEASDIKFLLPREQDELERLFITVQNNNEHGNTLLHMACLREHCSLEDSDGYDSDGSDLNEALHSTVHIINLLLDKGIPLSSQNNQHKTALALIVDDYIREQQDFELSRIHVATYLLLKLVHEVEDEVPKRAVIMVDEGLANEIISNLSYQQRSQLLHWILAVSDADPEKGVAIAQKLLAFGADINMKDAGVPLINAVLEGADYYAQRVNDPEGEGSLTNGRFFQGLWLLTQQVDLQEFTPKQIKELADFTCQSWESALGNFEIVKNIFSRLIALGYNPQNPISYFFNDRMEDDERSFSNREVETTIREKLGIICKQMVDSDHVGLFMFHLGSGTNQDIIEKLNKIWESQPDNSNTPEAVQIPRDELNKLIVSLIRMGEIRGGNLLMKAIEGGHEEVILATLEHPEIYINADDLDNMDCTAINYAIRDGNPETIILLLSERRFSFEKHNIQQAASDICNNIIKMSKSEHLDVYGFLLNRYRGSNDMSRFVEAVLEKIGKLEANLNIKIQENRASQDPTSSKEMHERSYNVSIEKIRVIREFLSHNTFDEALLRQHIQKLKGINEAYNGQMNLIWAKNLEQVRQLLQNQQTIRV